MGKNGRTLRDIWREKGHSEEEVQRLWDERIEKIRAVKRRNYLRKIGMDGETLGLKAEYMVAMDIEKRRKAYFDGMKKDPAVHNRKGVRSQTRLAREAQKRSEKALKRAEAEYNPRFKAKGVEGLVPDADGYIGLREARKQRPDLFDRPNTDIYELLRGWGVKGV